MSVFGAYSQYYDLLYKDKDYVGEAEYVRQLIERYQPGAQSLLDLGCGTGRHALLLASRGYSVTGVDRSPEMLTEARAQAAKLGASVKPEFAAGDVRSVRVERTFDVVVSLFHVMSYQVSNEDLKAAFQTAKAHLKPGGVFIFDCWYGPAVLSERPSARTRHLENEQISVTRTAEPVSHPNRNCVDVNYHVLIENKQSHARDELRETHTMRYLFVPEVELLLDGAGLALRDSMEFLSNRELGLDTWTAVFVATPKA